ncbi:MAG: hypothetical protein K2O08_04925, partial [Clostridia bacterium]|nr:hypothetical protein [Clostridia bacterium]
MKVAFIGHKYVNNMEEVIQKIEQTLEKLIVEQGADEFLFVNHSQFESLCYDVVTRLKLRYQNIKRVYIGFPCEEIRKKHHRLLLSKYDRTEYPERLKRSGVMSIIRQNEAAVDMCDLLITYYDKNYKTDFPYYEKINISYVSDGSQPQSETKITLNYAFRKDKDFVNLFEDLKDSKYALILD